MDNTDPAGYLSAIFSGRIRLERGPEGISLPSTPGLKARGRVCEQLWLSTEMFVAPSSAIIYATTEESYKDEPIPGRTFPPGAIGEQLMLHSTRHDLLKENTKVVLGDATLEVAGTWDLAPALGATQSFPVLGFRILENGLVEPGAPLLIK